MAVLFYCVLFCLALIENTDARALRRGPRSIMENPESVSTSCPSLHVPAHGAIACINSGRGRYCSVFCNRNHDVPHPVGEVPITVFTCDSSGNWSPNPNTRDCSGLRIPTRNNLPSEKMYFSGKCTSHFAMATITDSFLELMRESAHRDICSTTDDCDVENVMVSCHSSARRHRKRSQVGSPHINNLLIGGSTTVSLQEMSHRVRAAQERVRSAANEELLLRAGNKNQITEERLLVLGKRILDLFKTGQDIITGFFESYELGDAVNDYLRLADGELDCPDGYVALKANNACVPCTAGHYFDRFLRICRKCDFGFYQDSDAQLECIPCDAGQWTLADGSRNRTDCRNQCEAGHFSTSGFSPCSHCPLSTFQPLIGQTQCLRCPDGKRTLDSGATHGDQCVFLENL